LENSYADNGGLNLTSATLYTQLEIEPLNEGMVVELAQQDAAVGAIQSVLVVGLGPALEYRSM